MTDFHSIEDTGAPASAVWADLKSRGPELYREFCKQPIGAHSPNLHFILQHFRKAPVAGKYVLVAIEPHRRWVLGTLTGVRGDPVRLIEEHAFDDIAEAERFVFRLRWRDLTGEQLAPWGDQA